MPAHCVLWWVRLGALWSLFLKFFICVFIWLHWVLVVAHGIKSPDQGSNSRPHHCEHKNLNHSTTREVPGASFIRHESHAFSTSQGPSLIPSPLGVRDSTYEFEQGTYSDHTTCQGEALEIKLTRVPHIQVSRWKSDHPQSI